MFAYQEEPNPLNVKLLPNIDVKKDDLPIAYPYVPRICKEQGYMFIWYGTPESDPDLVEDCLRVKNEPQWISCEESWKIETGIALIYPYKNEIIIGAVKTPGYMKKRTSAEIRNVLRHMWRDIIHMFGDKKIICPSGSYFEYLHMSMSQIKIPHEAYHWKIMKQNGFKRDGHYWIRN
jgi:hypothetical protein